MQVLLCSWMSRWCLDISGTLIEVVNYLEKLLFKKKKRWILRFCGLILIRYCWKGTREKGNGYIGYHVMDGFTQRVIRGHVMDRFTRRFVSAT